MQAWQWADTVLASVPGRFFFNSVQLETDRPGVEANTVHALSEIFFLASTLSTCMVSVEAKKDILH